jgi:hypothetical protein
MEFLSISKQTSSTTYPVLAFEPYSQAHEQYAIKIEQIWYDLPRTSIWANHQYYATTWFIQPGNDFNEANLLRERLIKSTRAKPNQNLLNCNNY